MTTVRKPVRRLVVAIYLIRLNRDRSAKFTRTYEIGQMTRLLMNLLLVAAVVSTQSVSTQAHSLKELEGQLVKREKYFQPIDQPAPEFTLQDAGGRSVGLMDLHGKVSVLHFIYTSCPDVCPLHAERIAEIQELVNKTPMRAQVQFVSITTDPDTDTSEVMREYGPTHGLDAANWIFLTRTTAQPEHVTRELAETFGHKFTKNADGYQLHGVVTHVIDMEGRWRANFHGLEFDTTSAVVFINALVNDYHPASERQHDSSFWDWLRALF